MPEKYFSSCYLKIERANQHIEELYTLVQGFIKDNPYRFVVEKDAKAGTKVVRIELTGEIPPHVSTIAGDAIHNLRSALDHLVCRLVGANGNETVSNNGFPFGETRKSLDSMLEAKTKGASKDAIDMLKSLETYKGGKGQILWLINRLDVLDKHEGLIIMGRLAAAPDMIVTDADGKNILTMAGNKLGGLQQNMTVLSTSIDSNIEIKDKGHTPVEIIFSGIIGLHPNEVVTALKQFSQLVLGVVDTFDAKFG